MALRREFWVRTPVIRQITEQEWDFNNSTSAIIQKICKRNIVFWVRYQRSSRDHPPLGSPKSRVVAHVPKWQSTSSCSTKALRRPRCERSEWLHTLYNVGVTAARLTKKWVPCRFRSEGGDLVLRKSFKPRSPVHPCNGRYCPAPVPQLSAMPWVP